MRLQVCEMCIFALLSGRYKLEVLWNNDEIMDSPFDIEVMEGAGAAKILVQQDTLKFGIIGQEMRTVIDTRLAPPGTQRFS